MKATPRIENRKQMSWLVFLNWDKESGLKMITHDLNVIIQRLFPKV